MSQEGKMENMEWYLPVSQVAEILGCHRRDVYEMLKQGHFSYILLPDSGIKISERSVCRLMGVPAAALLDEEILAVAN